MKLNENIKNFRIFRGIKQQQLADALGKSKSVISNWERGENSPDPDSCEKLCKILKVTPNQLFGWEENPDYVKHVQKMQKYQADIDKLRVEIYNLQRQIENIETIKFQEQNPLLDDDDDEVY